MCVLLAVRRLFLGQVWLNENSCATLSRIGPLVISGVLIGVGYYASTVSLEVIYNTTVGIIRRTNLPGHSKHEPETLLVSPNDSSWLRFLDHQKDLLNAQTVKGHLADYNAQTHHRSDQETTRQ